MDKPGNIGPGQDFSDTTYSDFLVSIHIIGKHAELVSLGKETFGEGILGYVRESLEELGMNAHLGTALLLMPLTKTASGLTLPTSTNILRERLRSVLDEAGEAESILVCRAIKEMSPAGLRDPYFVQTSIEEMAKSIEKEGIAYREWMNRGADLDGVAKETTEGYPRVFRYAESMLLKGAIRKNILSTYLEILSEGMDTLVLGTRGEEVAGRICAMAHGALKARSTAVGTFEDRVQELNRYCVEEDANPGTTADLVAASIYVALLCGGRP